MARGAFGTVAFRMGRLADALGDDGLKAMTEAAAWEIKTAASRRLVRTIGGDRRMSRFGSKRSRGRVRGGVGYDYDGKGKATVTYRPAGFWMLLEDAARPHAIGTGRRTATGRYSRSRGAQRPVLAMADGRVVTGPVEHPGTRPKKVLTRALAEGEDNVPAAVDKAISDLVKRLLED